MTLIMWSKNTYPGPRPKEFGSEGQKLSAAKSCCDWSWRMSWRESFVSTSSTMFRSRSNSPHGVSSRQFNFEPFETLSTYHTIEPVKGIIYGTTWIQKDEYSQLGLILISWFHIGGVNGTLRNKGDREFSVRKQPDCHYIGSRQTS